jgi:hypothetical protein
MFLPLQPVRALAPVILGTGRAVNNFEIIHEVTVALILRRDNIPPDPGIELVATSCMTSIESAPIDIGRGV